MTPREIAIKAVMIAALAGALLGAGHVLGWIAKTDAKVEQSMREAYCHGVAAWQAEAAQGVPELQRTGHPDYNGHAAERCPGLRPAGSSWEIPTRSTERQLARK